MTKRFGVGRRFFGLLAGALAASATVAPAAAQRPASDMPPTGLIGSRDEGADTLAVPDLEAFNETCFEPGGTSDDGADALIAGRREAALSPYAGSYALLVGVEAYDADGLMGGDVIEKTGAQLEAIKATLEEVHHFTKVCVLLNPSKADLSGAPGRPGVVEQFINAYGRTEPADKKNRLFIYFSGHGTQVAVKTQSGEENKPFFLPRDAPAYVEKTYPGLSATQQAVRRARDKYDHFRNHAFALQGFLDGLTDVGAHALVAFRNCFAGDVAASLQGDGVRAQSVDLDPTSAGLPRDLWVTREPAVYVIASGAPDMPVREDAPFPDYLNLGLKGVFSSNRGFWAHQLGGHIKQKLASAEISLPVNIGWYGAQSGQGDIRFSSRNSTLRAGYQILFATLDTLDHEAQLNYGEEFREEFRVLYAMETWLTAAEAKSGDHELAGHLGDLYKRGALTWLGGGEVDDRFARALRSALDALPADAQTSPEFRRLQRHWPLVRLGDRWEARPNKMKAARWYLIAAKLVADESSPRYQLFLDRAHQIVASMSDGEFAALKRSVWAHYAAHLSDYHLLKLRDDFAFGRHLGKDNLQAAKAFFLADCRRPIDGASAVDGDDPLIVRALAADAGRRQSYDLTLTPDQRRRLRAWQRSRGVRAICAARRAPARPADEELDRVRSENFEAFRTDPNAPELRVALHALGFADSADGPAGGEEVKRFQAYFGYRQDGVLSANQTRDLFLEARRSAPALDDYLRARGLIDE